MAATPAPVQGEERHLTAARAGVRLDVYLAECLPDLSRSAIQRLIREGHVRVDGHTIRPGLRLEGGESISVTVPPPEPLEVAPERMDLHILYEDADLMAVDKPAGLPVHPALGHREHTLVNGLLAQVKGLSSIGGKERPGIVHRLDKDTSGVILVAKNDAAHRELSRQFQAREMEKEYLCLVRGYPDPLEGVIDAPIGRDPRNRKRMAIVRPEKGRQAVTRYRTLASLSGYSLVEAHPETGRTHQVRVHLAAIHHPVVGDALYGGRSSLLQRQFLHARRLTIRHPRTGEVMTFTAPLPEDLAGVLREVAGEAEKGVLKQVYSLL